MLLLKRKNFFFSTFSFHFTLNNFENKFKLIYFENKQTRFFSASCQFKTADRLFLINLLKPNESNLVGQKASDWDAVYNLILIIFTLFNRFKLLVFFLLFSYENCALLAKRESISISFGLFAFVISFTWLWEIIQSCSFWHLPCFFSWTALH